MAIGHFFAVDRDAWAEVCRLGINPAVSYLVMARGTGADQRTTAWSIQAIEKHTGIARARAKLSIDLLLRRGAVRIKKLISNRPLYELLPVSAFVDVPAHSKLESGEVRWIWLPNELVTPVGDESPAIERIRETGDVETLKLLIDLYGEMHLADDAGIDWRILRRSFIRKKILEYGQFIIFGFSQSCWSVFPAAQESLTYWPESANPGVDEGGFWRRFQTLLDLRLVHMVGHLVEADTDDAEIIHPLALSPEGEAEERAVGYAAHDAASAMVEVYGPSKLLRLAQPMRLVSVLRHQSRAQVVGIPRLRYRPRTRDTSRWYGRMVEESEKWVKIHNARYPGAPSVAQMKYASGNRQ
jgi:hypothetical protein